MDWVSRFYERQGELAGLYSGDPGDHAVAQAARISRLAPGATRVLELGAGGDQAAAVAADGGLVVTAVELVPRAAANARRLAVDRPGMTVVEGDMYDVDLGADHFDAVVYWDGFGLGDDGEQLLLLRRINDWLADDGRLLIDVYTPWYWAVAAGRVSSYGTARSGYDFDAYGCRMINRWWDEEDGGEEAAVHQSLRCYSPPDVALLGRDAALAVTGVEAGGAVDHITGVYTPAVPLARAMSYTVTLERA